MTYRICIVIPAYNEAPTIRAVVRGVKKTLSKQAFKCDIVVVDDGSKDATATEAQSGGALVIGHILNSGAGGATATGLSYADQKNYDMAATMDADGQHSPEDLIKGLKIARRDQTDLLIGSRLINPEGMSRVKQLGNNGLSTITYLLFGVRVTDSQSGLRIFSRHALSELRWKTSGYEFCSEMLWRARQKNLIISEYPIKAIYTEYSKAKGQNNWNAFYIIKSLLRRRITEILSE